MRKKAKLKKPKSKTSKKTKSQKSEPLLPAEMAVEIEGAVIILASVLAFISLFSFAYGHTSTNWVGAIGFSIGWILHSTFGVLSYPVTLFFGWIGALMLFKPDQPLSTIKKLSFVGIIVSVGILLSLVEVGYPQIGEGLKELFYPLEKRFSFPYHLGGIPLMYLYSEIPTINLANVFNEVGVAILFSFFLILSLFLFFGISFQEAYLWLKDKKPTWKWPERPQLKKAPVKAKEEKSESFMDYFTERASESLELVKPKKAPKVKVNIAAEAPPPPVEPPPPAPPEEKRERALKAQAVWNGDFKDYKLPAIHQLTGSKQTDQSQLKKELMEQARVLEETLASFGIEAKVGEIHCGPTITSFEVHPAVGVKVQKIKALENDIALNMQAASIRIIAPIPGKAAVGVEVPNPEPQEVNFRDMMSHYKKSPKKFHIPLLLGKNVSGEWIMSDLAKMPHLIIAGATGSGKSVCINTIVMSIIHTARPDEIQMLMVDPKKVELTPYSKLPHMIAPVITDPAEAYTAMQWLVKEMEKRYEILNRLHLRNIEAFNNRKIDEEKEAELNIEVPKKLPYMVGIIDELADLMMVSTYDIETPIARIAQMARAVGIHLILATQRPSREVITGLIKANFPTRICFKVSSGINSKIVLDSGGGEQLLGNGDMLFLPPGTSNLERVQGVFIRDGDIQASIESISAQTPPNYLIPSFKSISASSGADLFDPRPSDKDALYDQALDVVISTGNASTTFLQRKLKIGYARAASLMDQLEENGVVGPQEGSKGRVVLAKAGETE